MGYPYEPNKLPPDFDLDDLVVTPPDVDYTFHEKTTIQFAVPAPLGTVEIAVDDSSRYAVGMPLYFAGVGVFKVVGLPSATTISIESITATAAVSVQIGTPFNSCLLPDTTETEDTGLVLSDVLAASFTTVAAGAPVSVELVTGGWVSANQTIFVETGGWYRVTGITGKILACTSLNDGANPAAGGTVSPGARVFLATPAAYRPDPTSLPVVNTPNTPGGAVFSVGEQYPTAPGTAGTKILTGKTAAATFNSTAGAVALVATITFDPPFSAVPTVTLSLLAPGTLASGAYQNIYASTLSSTTLVISRQGGGNLGDGCQVMWTAIGV